VEYEEADSEDDSLREMVELAVQRLYEAMNPVMWDRQFPSAFNFPQELLLLQSISLEQLKPDWRQYTRFWTGQSTSKDWIAIKIEWIPVKDGCW